jgi:hypothetical protein
MEHGNFWKSKSRRRTLGGRWGILCLVVIAAVWHANADAENTRDFSAMFDMGPAQTVDLTHVSVKLFLRVRNNSVTDLSNATISLSDPLLPGKVSTPLATGISVPHRGSVKISGSVTVEVQEYRHWQRGEQPSLVIRVPGADGRNIDRPIELMRMPGMGAMR